MRNILIKRLILDEDICTIGLDKNEMEGISILVQFSFKNYKSFRDDTVLDMSATKITEHSDRVISIGKEKLLPTAAIYGANASGKSNVIEAFRFMTTYVMDSFAYGGEHSEDKRNAKMKTRTPFLFDEHSSNEESSFEVYFITSEEEGGKTYNYGFALTDSGVSEEWLNVKAKTAKEFKSIFYREGDKLEFKGIPANSQESIKIAFEKEALVVSLGAKLKVSKLKMISDWFLNVNFANFGNPIEDVFLSRLIPDHFADDKDVQKNVVKYFASFDPSIIGFNVRTFKNEDDEECLKIDAIHKIAGTDKTVKMPLEEESDGTLKMFALYPALQAVLETGGLLCVDDLNASLHPLLIRNLLITFLNTTINKNHAQIIFTTHDTWQLSNNLLRRDEIWFTDKADDGATTLYSLADFVDEDGMKIRKDESYEKNYLLGKYKAIPSLKTFDMF